MEKVLAPIGTLASLTTLLDDMQVYLHRNYTRLIDFMFDSYGVNAKVDPGGNIISTDLTLKVTSSSGTNLVIAAGDAITSGLNYLSVGSPLTVASSTFPASGTHGLYLKHQQVLSAYVDVTNGGFYGPGTKTTPSRQTDFYVAAWDSPSISGVWLADVAFSGSNVTSVTDRRSANTLKYSQKIVNPLTARLDAEGVQTFADGIAVPYITVSSGVDSALLNYENLYDLINPLSPAPKNFRIVDVTIPTLSSYTEPGASAWIPQSASTGLPSHELKIYLKWNWDDIQGAGKDTYSDLNADQFRIVDYSPYTHVWAQNELVGFFLWDSINNKNYKIVSNAVTAATYEGVTDITVIPFRHTSSIQSVSFTGNKYAWIHSGAERYEIVATPVTTGGVLDSAAQIEGSVTSNSDPTSQHKIFNLSVGTRYEIKIRSIRKFKPSEYTILSAGTFYKKPPFVTVNPYESPFLVRHPDIDSTGAAIGASATSAGFVVDIIGWNAATDFEICWSSDAGGANFENLTHEKRTTRSTKVDIAVSDGAAYNVKVRPLFGGQVVAQSLSTNVVSGAGGATPAGTAYPLSIVFKSYSGTFGAYQEEGWLVTELCSPANSGRGTSIGEDMLGGIIEYSGTNLSVEQICGIDHNQLYIIDYATGVEKGPGTLTGTFTVGTTLLGRELHRSDNFPIDIQLTAVQVEQFSRGTKNEDAAPVLRWYQSGHPELADSLILDSLRPTTYAQSTDVTITAANGSRNLVIDMWDPSLGDNVTGFQGNVTIYYKPYVRVGRPGTTNPVIGPYLPGTPGYRP